VLAAEAQPLFNWWVKGLGGAANILEKITEEGYQCSEYTANLLLSLASRFQRVGQYHKDKADGKPVRLWMEPNQST
jgi:hypothetical protein